MDLFCPGKLNLALDVGSPRGDGLHPLASWMVAIDFGDRLVVEKATEATSTFERRFPDSPAGAVPWPLENDLVYRAHAALEQRAGGRLPVSVRVEKRIPAGTGLGGGSSDAAALLVAVRALFRRDLTDDDLAAIAIGLGSDVPFLVRAVAGAPSALVEGTGERVTPLSPPRPGSFALFLPEIESATGAVYRRFDAARRAGGDPDPGRVRAAATEPLTDDGLFNELAEPAEEQTPELRAVRERIAAAIGRRVHLTGSGSGLFALAADGSEARSLARQAAATTGVWSRAVRALAPGQLAPGAP